MKGLLAKLAAAPEGSEEQDIEIYRAVYAEPAKHRRYPRYTTSVDDQLPWENIWQVLRWEGEWSAWHANPKTFRNTEGRGHTEAIARRVAALKAWDAGADNFGITTPRRRAHMHERKAGGSQAGEDGRNAADDQDG